MRGQKWSLLIQTYAQKQAYEEVGKTEWVERPMTKI